MIPKFIFGLGTGRCGTWTLSRILAAQPDVYSKHEGTPLPWERDEKALWYQLLNLAINIDAPTIATTSYVWINYVGLIMGHLINPRFICLRRPRREVVESFLEHSPANNHWTDPKSLHWDPNKDFDGKTSNQWPKFNMSKRDALGAYWDAYYNAADYLEANYPQNFKIFDLDDALNNLWGQRRMLTFAGIEEGRQVIALGQKLNALHKPKGEISSCIAPTESL